MVYIQFNMEEFENRLKYYEKYCSKNLINKNHFLFLHPLLEGRGC
jgi:hypothetical protein